MSARFTAALATPSSSPVTYSDLIPNPIVQDSLALLTTIEQIQPRHFAPRREYIWTHDVALAQTGVIT